MALFDVRARAVAPDYDPHAHRDAVAAICARVDGMPLALELAAARVSVFAPGELLARLERSFGVLARGPRDLAARHRSLRAALDWTYALLEPGEQTLLARLAAFAGPAPLEAVEVVAEVAAGRGPVDALEALSGLVDASFVRRVDSREYGVRYTVAQAVRDYAAEQLVASGEERAARLAHATHVATVGETFRGMGTPEPVGTRVFSLDAEFRAALDWTREHAPELHTPVAAALGLVLVDSGRTREAYGELGLAIERSGISGAANGWAAVIRAFAAVTLGSRSEAPLLEAGLAAQRAAGDTSRLVLALRVAAVYWTWAGEPEQALRHTTEALALARSGLDGYELGLSLNEHASVLIGLGRLDEGEALLHEAVPLLSQAGSSLDAEGWFDELAAARGDWARAARAFLANARSAKQNTGMMGTWLRQTAIALARLGADEDALELAAAAKVICDSVDEPLSDPVTVRYGQALDDARERIGPERAERATRRGDALPESAGITRAAEMVQAACTA